MVGNEPEALDHFFDDLWRYEDGTKIHRAVCDRLPGFLEFIEQSLIVSRDHFDLFGINYNDHYGEMIGYSRIQSQIRNRTPTPARS